MKRIERKSKNQKKKTFRKMRKEKDENINDETQKISK